MGNLIISPEMFENPLGEPVINEGEFKEFAITFSAMVDVVSIAVMGFRLIHNAKETDISIVISNLEDNYWYDVFEKIQAVGTYLDCLAEDDNTIIKIVLTEENSEKEMILFKRDKNEQ